MRGQESPGPLSFVAAVFVGSYWGEGDIMAYLVSRYLVYGPSVRSTPMYSRSTPGGSGRPLLMGVTFDSTGSYDSILIPFLLLLSPAQL